MKQMFLKKFLSLVVVISMMVSVMGVGFAEMQPTTDSTVLLTQPVDETQTPTLPSVSIETYTPTETPIETATPIPTSTEISTETPTPTIAPSNTPTSPLLYPEWKVGITYIVGDRVVYEGMVYICLNAHTSIIEWTPLAAPVLWMFDTAGATPTPAMSAMTSPTPIYPTIDITPNVPVSGSINSFGEIDTYKYIPASNTTMSLNISHNNSTRVVLTNVYGTSLYEKQNYGSGSFVFEYKVAVNTTYYLKVYTVDTSYLSYTINLTELSDDYGDTIDKATPIENNKLVSGNLMSSSDIDYFSFVPSQTGIYKFERSSGDYYFYLQDGLGNTIYSSSYGTSAYYGALMANQVYYIKVMRSYYTVYSYTVRVSGPIEDDYGNDRNNAYETKLDTSVNVNINYPNDIDYFSFQPLESGFYCIEDLSINNTNYTSLNYALSFYNNNGQQIYLNYDSKNRQYYYELTKAQKYYIRISNSSSPYTYSFKVKGPVIDDMGNTPSTAKTINIEEIVEGSIDYYGDYDAFCFTPVNEGLYYIVATGVTNQYISLYDCNYILVNKYPINNDVNKVYYNNLDVNKTYYIVLGGNTSISEYSLMVKGPIHDDFGNTISTGNIIRLNSNINGKIDYAGDKDVFIFVPSTSGSYYIQTNSDNGLSINVLDSYGSQISSQISFESKERVLKCNLTANNRYNIQIEHYDSLATGSYSFSVSDTASFMVKGYIKPDVTLIESTAPVLNSGFKVEIVGTSLSAVTDQNGYFEIMNVPENSTGFTVKISKENYLFRQIENVIITSDKEIATSSAPIEMWAGDILLNGTQDNAINISDVMEIAKVFGKTLGNEGFNKNCDLNLDNAINVEDIMILAKHYNKIPDNYSAI